MAQLADAISHLNAREIERNEAALAACFPQPSPELTESDRAGLVPFAQWCDEHRVRCVGARPTTVAAFLRWLADKGVKSEKIIDAVASIECLHDAAGLANPVATATVRSMLESVTSIKPPRSWTKDEKISFVQLPADIRAAIERRDTDRELALRRKQNELADEKKRLLNGADTKPVETEKETTNGKET